MSEERNYTSIQISKETRDRIKELALSPNESYENILIRLLESKLASKEVEYLLQNSSEDCNVKAVVDWNDVADDNPSVKFYDKNGDCSSNVPVYVFDDKDFQLKWDEFRDTIESLENIVSILAVLGDGESISTGDIVLSRL